MYARFFRNPAEYVAEQVNIVKQRCSQHRAKTPDDTFTDERRSCNCKSLCKDLKTARRALKRAARIVFQRPTIGHTIDGADAIPVPEKLRITPHEETPAPPSYSEDDEDARIWGPIRKIPNERYVKLALKYGPLYVETIDGEILPTEAEVTGHARGGNNRVTFVEYNNGTKIVIRVPACGWNPAWLAIDAEAMVNQVKVMKYLKRKTGIPIPEVINYDTTIDDNILGAPYVMMECLPGEAVCWAWWENNDILPLEQKRQNIMRSLAKTMVKLHNLKFDAIGGLHFQDDDDGTKGEPWVDDFINIYSGMGPRDEEFLQTPEEERRVPEFDTSQEFMRLQLEGWRDDELEKWPGPFDRDVRERAQINGKYALYSILIDYMPFSELTTDVGDLEYFVIAPPDFDWQNVLVDEHGNVTGLIDWDVVKTTPRFTGWAALPNWLKQDWYEDYIWPSWGPINTMHTDELALCRHDYATYMKVACRAAGRDEDGEEVDDHKFTWRSHFYARIMDTIGEDGMDDMLHRLLDLFCPRTNKYAFIGNIGKKGFAPGQEEFLRNNLSKILAGASIHFAKLDIEIHDLPPDSHDMAFNNDRTADSAHNSSIEPVHPSSIGTISLVSPDFVAAARADPERFACMYASIKAHVDQITLEIQEATATIRELGKEVQRQESRIERLRQEIQGKDEIIKHLYAHLQRDAFQNAHQNLGGAPQAGAPATANDLQRDRGEATEDAQQLGLRARCNTLETLEEVDEASDSARDEQKADELDP